MPLVITRRPGEAFKIGPDISIAVVEVRGEKVRLAVTAPKQVPVHRDDINATEPKEATNAQ